MNGQTQTDGFHLVLDALKLNGVENLYGVAGIPITDLLRLAHAEGFRYIGFRHEQSAANAAAIAGFITGKPGICFTVSAPGFLNGLTALANATTNCFPMILARTTALALYDTLARNGADAFERALVRTESQLAPLRV